jgi:hypothetical protein
MNPLNTKNMMRNDMCNIMSALRNNKNTLLAITGKIIIKSDNFLLFEEEKREKIKVFFFIFFHLFSSFFIFFHLNKFFIIKILFSYLSPSLL